MMTVPFLTLASITDFRSISGTIEVPLDAPVVLIHGPNGAGKTSLLSGIEMAATGKVDSLQLADGDYFKHLVHWQAKEARIALATAGDVGRPASLGEWKIINGRASGEALFSPLMARFFSDRCYLAQATLSRLIDIYAHKGDSESRLAQFVREQLRIEQLEALIDGLHAAGDVRRTKKLVPEYKHALDLKKQIANGRDLNADKMQQLIIERDILLRNHLNNRDLLAASGVDISAPEYQLDFDSLNSETVYNEEADENQKMEVARDRREIQILSGEWAELSRSVLLEEQHFSI